MKNLLLLYASQTGFTQRYAQWIGQALGLAPLPLEACSKQRLAAADLVIFGGSVRGGILTGQAKLERLCRRVGDRPIVWFATGIRPATPRTLELVRKNNFAREANPLLFYFRGGLAPEALSPGDKTLLLCYRAMLRRRRALEAEDEGLLPLLGTASDDYTDPAQIAPLVHRVQALSETLPGEAGDAPPEAMETANHSVIGGTL